MLQPDVSRQEQQMLQTSPRNWSIHKLLDAVAHEGNPQDRAASLFATLASSLFPIAHRYSETKKFLTYCLKILPVQAFLNRTLYLQFSRYLTPTAWFSLYVGHNYYTTIETFESMKISTQKCQDLSDKLSRSLSSAPHEWGGYSRSHSIKIVKSDLISSARKQNNESTNCFFRFGIDGCANGS